MEHSSLGNPKMNSTSDSSVGHQQEAPQHLLDPATVRPFTNQCMYVSLQILIVTTKSRISTIVDYREMSTIYIVSKVLKTYFNRYNLS